MLIDDDEVANFVNLKTIESTHLVNQIKIFTSGDKAIEFLKVNLNNIDLLPEIILLDLNMPVMDGFEFLSQFIGLNPRIGKKINIYVVSSSLAMSDHDRIRSINAVSDFIIKPITKQKFEKLVEVLTEKASVN